MPLSKNIIEKENAQSVVINYKPKTIDHLISEQALDYAKNKDARGDFRVDKIVAGYVGIDTIEKQSQQREIANEAVRLSREVQEDAYKLAYGLGLKEGKEAAFNEEKARVESEMQNFRHLIEEIKVIKSELMMSNEKQIVELCFYIAKRLLMKEVESNPEYIKTLIKRSLEMAQSDEEVTIRMSVADKKWVDQYQEEVFKELNLDQSTRIEEDAKISPGGVVVETNHGVIDATIEQRLEKLETILKGE